MVGPLLIHYKGQRGTARDSEDVKQLAFWEGYFLPPAGCSRPSSLRGPLPAWIINFARCRDCIARKVRGLVFPTVVPGS